MLKKKHIKEFSKHADSYNLYTKVQQDVAKKLVSYIDKKRYKRVLDLGCGTGNIYKLIGERCEFFIAVDASSNMCEIHPKDDEKVKIFCRDFDDESLYDDLSKFVPFDLVLSSSSLQWSCDLKKVFENVSKMSENFAFSIFTDGTFKEIYKLSRLESFLPNIKEVLSLVGEFVDVEFEVEKRKLYFEDNLSLFRYIKKSGVSGGEAKLSYKEIKNLIKNYPLDYLEFEILYIVSLKNKLQI